MSKCEGSADSLSLLECFLNAKIKDTEFEPEH